MITFHNNVKMLAGKRAIDKIPYEMVYFNCSRALIIIDESVGAKYLQAFAKIIKCSDVVFDTITVGINHLVADIDKAITKFYESSSNAIIALGGSSAVDIGKAVKYAVSHNEKTFRVDNDALTRGAGNIPLFVVPTDYGTKNCASLKSMLIDYDMKRLVYNSEFMSANAVVLDPRMTRFTRECDLITAGTFALLMALCANIEGVSPYARGYALSAIELVREYGYYNEKAPQSTRRFAILCSTVYAGIAFDESSDKLLPLIALRVSYYAKITYKQAFNALAPHYLNMYMNKANNTNDEWLISFIGLDNAVAIDSEKRNQNLIDKLLDMLTNYRVTYNVKMRLSDYGVTSEDLINIYNQAVKSKDVLDEEDTKHNILELLNRAL